MTHDATTLATPRTAAWHLTCSTPSNLLHYFNPKIPFSRQINRLQSRFRAVQHLCESGPCETGESAGELFALRDALAFHLVKMSSWWDFAFCPRSAAGIRGTDFLAFVKNHAARSADDDAFFDLLTWQHHARTTTSPRILVLGQDPSSSESAPIYVGLDAKREFRISLPASTAWQDSRALDWSRSGYRDFASAWLAARTMETQEAGDHLRLREYLFAQREHDWARVWHQRHFCRPGESLAVQAYLEACQQAERCRTPFASLEFAHVVGRLAYEIMQISQRTGRSLRQMFRDVGQEDHADGGAGMIELQAMTYEEECLDATIETSGAA